MKYLLMFLMTVNVFASEVKVLCYDRFEDEMVDLVTTRNFSCMGDFVWGKEELCFEGDASDLVDLINNEHFDYGSSGYVVSDAFETKEGVSYTGYDQNNWWEADRTIKPCK